MDCDLGGSLQSVCVSQHCLSASGVWEATYALYGKSTYLADQEGMEKATWLCAMWRDGCARSHYRCSRPL
eukprot:3797591-Rhodomonas_salina.1